MREEKWGRGLSVMFVVLPLAYVLALAAGFGLVGARTLLLFAVGCAFAGMVVGRWLGRWPAVLQMLLCAALAGLGAWVLPVRFEHFWLRYVVLALGVLFTLIVEYQMLHAGSSRSGQQLMIPIPAFLASCAILWMALRIGHLPAAEPWGIMAALGACWIVAAAALLNRSALRRAAWADSQREIPAAARRAGMAGIGVFLALCFALSLIGAISQALSRAAEAVGRWLIAAYLWLNDHLLLKTDTPQAGPRGSMQLPVGPAKEQPQWAMVLQRLLGIVIVAVAVGAVLYLLYRKLPRVVRAIRDRLRQMYGNWAEEEDPYHDKNESLLSLREALKNAGSRWERFARRFRPRPKLSDFATDAERARFLFRELLHRLRQKDHLPPPGATAREILRAQRPADGMDALERGYAAARYAEAEPSPADIREAARAMDVK